MANPNRLSRRVESLVKAGDWDTILSFVRSGSLDCNAKIRTSVRGVWFRLLDAAICAKRVDVAQQLIECGADVNAAVAGQTPLILACGFRNHELIEALLAAGAEVNARAGRDEEGGGETALIEAAERRDLWAVKRLLRAGADPKILTFRKQTGVYCAVAARPTDDLPNIIRELVASGCPLLGNELHYPIYRRDVETTRLLLDLRCPPNMQLGHSEHKGPKKGDTPLTAAVGGNPIDLLECLGLKQERTVEKRQEITRMLLASGADPNLPNTKGWTPLMLTVRQKEFELAEILVDAGADPKYVPSRSKNESPVALATKNKMDDFVHLFQRSARKSPD